MCGIVGICFKGRDASPVLIAGLRSLEYRGYDSAGMTMHAPGLPTRRTEGRVDQLVEQVESTPLPSGPVGIAHTRWATHGAPSERNAHPHRYGKLAAVHNGILENFEQLRAECAERDGGNGHAFRSETDSEVWVALVWDELGAKAEAPTDHDMLSAISRAMRRAKGSYGLAIMHEDLPGQVYFARNESPLVVGLGQDGNYVASDIAALLELTHDFLYLEDGLLGRIWAEGYEIYDRDLNRRELSVDHVQWDAEATEKGGYEHYMLKEIEEQPLVVARTLHAGVSGKTVLPDFAVPDERLARFRRIVILACGTALHAARLGKYVIEQCAGLPVEVDYASEFRYRDPMVGADDLVLAISQSGETADTLGAMRVAIDRGATPIAICNVRGASLCRISMATILTQCGPEIGVASTKAFTAQLLALHLLAIRLGRARGVLDEADAERRVQALRLVKPAMEAVIGPAARDHVRDVATRYAYKPIFFFLGRGQDYPIALEGALKLKEISYVHAEGYPAGEMKHGPLALVSDEMVCVALAADSPTYEKVLGNVQEVKTRGGVVVTITNEGRSEAIDLADDVIFVPHCDASVAPLINVIPLQYLAYYVALERGCDIDKPRNLAKSVTVE